MKYVNSFGYMKDLLKSIGLQTIRHVGSILKETERVFFQTYQKSDFQAQWHRPAPHCLYHRPTWIRLSSLSVNLSNTFDWFDSKYRSMAGWCSGRSGAYWSEMRCYLTAGSDLIGVPTYVCWSDAERQCSGYWLRISLNSSCLFPQNWNC